jgi:hypothetical protein
MAMMSSRLAGVTEMEAMQHGRVAGKGFAAAP